MSLTIKYGERIDLNEFIQAVVQEKTVAIDAMTKDMVSLSRLKLEQFVRDGRTIYGVNTSMGGFVNWLVPIEKAQQLQINLINAVATNVGSYLERRYVRAIMLARIVSLSRGHSAISLDNLEKLIAVYNAGIIPCIPEKGSLGTSGDLGPLAAIALVCAGQDWKAEFEGEIVPARDALKMAGIEPMRLSFKEGLALINGTSGMVGLGCSVYLDAERLIDKYIDISALSFEGLAGKSKPFDPRVHRLKPHVGQQDVAKRLWNALEDSQLIVNERSTELILSAEADGQVKAGSDQIEDAYSIRCTPQIVGPILDLFRTIRKTLEDELNSSSDNPLIVPDEDEVFHNGHFHGQYVAMAMDQLVLGLVTLSNLANRRVDRFLDSNNSNGLPPFLCSQDAGLRLGLMGGQFMTASITAENRSLAMPISIQSLTTTADFQDIVSFGFVAARRARDVLGNTKYVIAFELLCACQAADIRGREGLSSTTRAIYENTRAIVPFLTVDTTITDYIEMIKQRILH